MNRHQSDMSGARLSRRGFLCASGGLVITFSLFGPLEVAAATNAGAGGVAPPPAGKLYAWLAVHPDNTVMVWTAPARHLVLDLNRAKVVVVRPTI